MNKLLIYALLAGCSSIATAGHAATLILDPVNGAVAGIPGATVGWGFTFMNSVDYAVITGSQFCTAASSNLPGGCIAADASFGTYTDIAGPQFLVIGPAPESNSITQVFDGVMNGIGSFAIDPGATGTLLGDIVVTYDLYSVTPNDPGFDPVSDLVSNGNFEEAPASITAGSPTAAPEPATLLLLLAGLVFGAWKGKRFTPEDGRR